MKDGSEIVDRVPIGQVLRNSFRCEPPSDIVSATSYQLKNGLLINPRSESNGSHYMQSQLKNY